MTSRMANPAANAKFLGLTASDLSYIKAPFCEKGGAVGNGVRWFACFEIDKQDIF